MEFGLLGLIILIADIYAIYQIFTSGASGLSRGTETWGTLRACWRTSGT